MLTSRVIVCLDVRDGRVVKGVKFESLRDVGDPAALAARYEREGADEIVLLDVSASSEGRATLLDVARSTAEQLFIPLTIGGGVRSAEDVGLVLRAGADKVAINTAAVRRPEVLTESAERFGTQCVVASIDARRRSEGNWEVCVRGGQEPTGLDAVAWARECVERGAGEILLTSIDRDGARAGYDVELTRAVSSRVDVPVIASGGAGRPSHLRDALREGGADAVLVAGILHDGDVSVDELKAYLQQEDFLVRRSDV